MIEDSVDAVVIGAGVVGLAVARALALAGHEVLILERHGLIGSEISSRNSEVIHAGIYYPQHSLKARLCVAGKQKLYPYLKERGIAHQRCGKLIVASQPSQVEQLHAIRQKAALNGVDDLVWLNGDEARALEPELRVEAALFSPSTGIMDSHGLMVNLLGDAEAHGAMLVLNCPVARIRPQEDHLEIETGGNDAMRLKCRVVVNAAGHAAPGFAAMARGQCAAMPKGYLAKGHYFRLVGARPFKHLVYPIPEQAGLGIHATIDLNGQTRFGPDVEWVTSVDYSPDASRVETFRQIIAGYYPAIERLELEPDYTGIRPKINAPGETAADFMVSGPETHGIAGLVHLLGIESPGLTSSLAIADEVVQRLR